MAAFTIAALAAEITNDPKSLDFATLKVQSNGPEAVAAKLNEPGASAETLFKTSVPVDEMLSEIVFSEYTGWTALQKTNIEQLMRGDRVLTGKANVRTTLAALIPTGSSRTAMIALASRPATRAEILWGEFFVVTDAQASEAIVGHP